MGDIGMNRNRVGFIVVLLVASAAIYTWELSPEAEEAARKESLVAPGAKVETLATGFTFTEGPAADAEGNVFFTDNPNDLIYRWSVDGELSTFMRKSAACNGLYFDKDGSLLACAGGSRQIWSIDSQGKVKVLAYEYKKKLFNSTNDLWIDPKGGVYFTDPAWRHVPEQDGNHVYYLPPHRDREKIIRVIDDMVYPNGVAGTPDGKLLYVSDSRGEGTFVYTINSDGTLSNKKLFSPKQDDGGDGLTLDCEGNVYLGLTRGVVIYDPDGNELETIEVPTRPSNVIFGGRDKKTLFITGLKALFSIRMRVKGI